MGIADDAFDVLYADLVAAQPDRAGTDAVLCPICLRPITREQVRKQGVEHIIPRVVTREDAARFAQLGTLNQRSGITLLCREPRPVAGGPEIATDGCNGYKGRTYDWVIRTVLDQRPHARHEFRHRHGVAVLVMAYLAAFQTLGYGYILSPGLAEFREQFDYPDERKTDWLDQARIRLEPLTSPIIATAVGQPFAFGFWKHGIHVLFRRCSAVLPPLTDTTLGVQTLESLLPKLAE